MIYLDNAATSWPKPEAVPEAVARVLREGCGSPGRGGHRPALEAGRIVEDARAALARLFGAGAPDRVALGANATWALNLALKGALRPGDHVVRGAGEHNSVTRPLAALEERGVRVTVVPSSPEAGLDPDGVLYALRPETRMVAAAFASNVTGALNPVEELGRLCADRGVLFLVDAAQGAGHFPIDLGQTRIDLLAFPGHKGLLGPQGTGGLCLAPGLVLEPFAEGGTGTDSRSRGQPEAAPARYESGTPNTPGLAGLGAAVRYLTGAGTFPAPEHALAARLHAGLAEIRGVRVYGPPPGAARAPLVSFNIEGFDCFDAAAILEERWGLMLRAGLHCAPEAHGLIGTLETGALRASPGRFTGVDEVDACVAAVAELARSAAA